MPLTKAIIPSEVLSNNAKIPMLGLCSLGFNDVFGATTQAVKDAIDVGYRYIDTCPIGHNEREVGEAINAKIKEGVVKREDLYVVGKLWDTKAFHNPASMRAALLTTLRNLNLAYIDLYIINCPGGDLFASDAFVDTWYELENLVDLFLVKSIGLSNFNMEQIQHLLTGARVLPVVNQMECNPYLTQHELTEFCNKKNIIIPTFNVYGSRDLVEDPMIMSMAKKYKKTPEQILLRYQIEKGHVAVPDVRNKYDLLRNLDVFTFEMKKSDVDEMDKLDRHKL